MQQQMAFYAEMPDTYQVVLNVDHSIIKQLIEESENKEKDTLIAEVSSDGKLRQMVDLALLANGMLKGEALSNFVKRGFETL